MTKSKLLRQSLYLHVKEDKHRTIFTNINISDIASSAFTGPHFIRFSKRCINIFIFESEFCQYRYRELYHHRRSAKLILLYYLKEGCLLNNCGTNPTLSFHEGSFSPPGSTVIIVLYIGRFPIHSFLFINQILTDLAVNNCYIFKIIS